MTSIGICRITTQCRVPRVSSHVNGVPDTIITRFDIARVQFHHLRIGGFGCEKKPGGRRPRGCRAGWNDWRTSVADAWSPEDWTAFRTFLIDFPGATARQSASIPARKAAATMVCRSALLSRNGKPIRVPVNAVPTRSPNSTTARSRSRWRDIQTRPSTSAHWR